MFNKIDKTADGNPARVIGSAWIVMVCLVLVFAADINSWAITAEEDAVASAATPAAAAVLKVSEAVGIANLKDAITAGPLAFYAGQPEIGARNEQVTAVTTSIPDIAGPEVTTTVLDTQTAVTETVAAAPGKPKPTRILIIGDSTIESGLGTVLERSLEEYEGVTVHRYGQHSTGLARPDYFDWNVKLAELQEEFNPDLTIAYFGDNDCQGLSTIEGAFITKFGTEDWDTVYGERVTAIVEQMQAGGGNGVMVGMPIMRSKSFSRKVERLNGVVQAATEGAGGYFMPTWEMTSNEDGKYAASVEFDGKNRMIRAGDGIHFSRHGSEYVAFHLIEMLEENFDMEKNAE